MPVWAIEPCADGYKLTDEDGELIWSAPTRAEREAVKATQQRQFEQETGEGQKYYTIRIRLPVSKEEQ